MTRFSTPNFRGWHALIVHRSDDNSARLMRQLERLGVTAEVCWPSFPAGGDYADVIFFDADSGYDGLFPWANGESPMPLVALLGSELPGRIEWAINQSFSSHIVKPIQSNGVFSALMIACSNFEAEQQRQKRFLALQSRLDGRRAVFQAVIALMELGKIDDEAAYARIRSAAMARRLTVEEFCASLDRATMQKLLDDVANPKRGQSHR